MIKDLQKKFPDKIIGYSDHTLPKDMKILEMATMLGAGILEKHFTHDKKLPGNDHYHAMDKEDLRKFNNKLSQVFNILGDQKKHPLRTENLARDNARRSLVAMTHIKKNTTITKEHLTWKRPAHGICPRDIETAIGKKAIIDIAEDTVLQWNLLS